MHSKAPIHTGRKHANLRAIPSMLLVSSVNSPVQYIAGSICLYIFVLRVQCGLGLRLGDTQRSAVLSPRLVHFAKQVTVPVLGVATTLEFTSANALSVARP